jgi:hypothetical protein
MLEVPSGCTSRMYTSFSCQITFDVFFGGFGISLLKHFNHVFTLLPIKAHSYLSEFIIQESQTHVDVNGSDIGPGEVYFLALP